MNVDGALLLKKKQDGLWFTATEERLVIRPTLGSYLGLLGLFLGMLIWPWIVLPDAGSRFLLLLTLPPAAVFGAMILHVCGRWLTFDRKRDAVLWFPRTLCRMSSIRGVRMVKKVTRRKRSLWVSLHPALDLEDGKRVWLPGLITSIGGRIIAEWLNVGFCDEANPAVPTKVGESRMNRTWDPH